MAKRKVPTSILELVDEASVDDSVERAASLIAAASYSQSVGDGAEFDLDAGATPELSAAKKRKLKGRNELEKRLLQGGSINKERLLARAEEGEKLRRRLMEDG